MSRICLALSLILLSALSSPAQTPAAGFATDSILLSTTTTGEVNLYVTDTSTGATAITYIVHDPGSLSPAYATATGTIGQGQILNFSPPGLNTCLPYEVTQIAADGMGADTVTNGFQAGCGCFSNPIAYAIDVASAGNGQVTIAAVSNGDSPNRELLFGACPPGSATCQTTIPGPGSYEICAVFSGGTCSGSGTTFCDTVDILCSGPPSAAFSPSGTTTQTTFSDQSTGWNITSWQWDFGDGTASTDPSPAHTYATTGSYTVCLVVGDTCGSDTTCQSYVATCVNPTAAIGGNSFGLTANFQNQSTASGSPSVSWDFGDGTTSTQANPSHTYASAGTYTVCLSVTDNCGTDTVCSPFTVTCVNPQASFSVTTNNFAASFTDQSLLNGPGNYFWTFGDGASSSQANPTHTYFQNGTYTVCMVVSDACGTDSLCTTVTINCPQPAAAFSFSPNQLAVDFTDQSQNPGTWSWQFGDGNSSSQQNPTHTYAVPGTYQVCLVTAQACGSSTACQSVTVACPAPTVAFTSSQNQQTVQFTNQSVLNGNLIGYNWTFGDGSSSTASDPIHTYANPGSFQVCLTVQEDCGTSIDCQMVNVLVGVEGAGSTALEVVPNPADDRVRISWGVPLLEKGTLTVWDAYGRPIIVSPLETGSSDWVFVAGGLSEGIYWIELRTSQGISSRNLLVRH